MRELRAAHVDAQSVALGQSGGCRFWRSDKIMASCASSRAQTVPQIVESRRDRYAQQRSYHRDRQSIVWTETQGELSGTGAVQGPPDLI